MVLPRTVLVLDALLPASPTYLLASFPMHPFLCVLVATAVVWAPVIFHLLEPMGLRASYLALPQTIHSTEMPARAAQNSSPCQDEI